LKEFLEKKEKEIPNDEELRQIKRAYDDMQEMIKNCTHPD
jgi:hypothetical protein